MKKLNGKTFSFIHDALTVSSLQPHLLFVIKDGRVFPVIDERFGNDDAFKNIHQVSNIGELLVINFSESLSCIEL